MAPQYAKDQPKGFKNYIENVAIVGAGGTIGKFIVGELLKSPRIKVTAITRASSTTALPRGIETKKVDYESKESLTEAMKGQQVLIITMAPMAPPDTQTKLIDAAAAAGVPWIVPNEYGNDGADTQLEKDLPMIASAKAGVRKYIEQQGLNWIGIACGFWYEFSLGGSILRYGFEIANRKVLFFGDGDQPINTSTWAQCARQVARLFDLKVLPEDEHDKRPSLDMFRNTFCRASSFRVSQKDMFASLKRVTKTTDKDWSIESKPTEQLFNEGMEKFSKGDFTGFAVALYTRAFFKSDEVGLYGDHYGLHNELLRLPVEDLDEFTQGAVDFEKGAGNYGEQRAKYDEFEKEVAGGKK